MLKIHESNSGIKYIKAALSNTPDPEIASYVSKPLYVTDESTTSEIKKFHYATAGRMMQDDSELQEQERAEQAQKFVKKVQIQKKEFEKKRQTIETLEELRRKGDYEELHRRQEQEREDRIQKKRDEIEEFKRRAEERKEEQARIQGVCEEETRKYQQSQPLYKQLKRRYNEEVELPALERKKQQLREIRELHKPLNHEEFLEHEKHLEVQREEIRAKNKRSADFSYIKPSYHSAYHQKFEEEKDQVQRAREAAYEAKKQAKDKMREFSYSVQRPVANKRKQAEMRDIVEKLQKPPRGRRSRTLDRDDLPSKDSTTLSPRSKGLENLKVARQIKKYNSREEESEAKRKSDVAKSLNDSTSITRKDYWHDVKKKYNLHSQPENWKQVLAKQSLNPALKKTNILIEADKLEERARMKERVWKAHNPKKLPSTRYVDEEVEVDDMYINAIKAKLSVLMEVESSSKPQHTAIKRKPPVRGKSVPKSTGHTYTQSREDSIANANQTMELNHASGSKASVEENDIDKKFSLNDAA